MAINVISQLSVPTPTATTNAASKSYVDSAIIPEWNATTTYDVGTLVRYNNKIYQSVLKTVTKTVNGVSTTFTNLGQTPASGSTINGTYWREVTGTMCICGEWNENTTYTKNDIVTRYDIPFVSQTTGNFRYDPISYFNYWKPLNNNTNQIRHIGLTTQGPGPSEITLATLFSGYSCYTLMANSATRTFIFPYYDPEIRQVYTFDFMIRLQNKSSSSQTDSVTVTFKYYDENEDEYNLNLLDGTNQIVLDKGYTYFFVFRNFPSMYSDNHENATTSQLYNNSLFNVRQWTGNLQGRVPLIPVASE